MNNQSATNAQCWTVSTQMRSQYIRADDQYIAF